MPNFVSFAASIAELAHGEKSRTHPAYLMPGNRRACTSEYSFTNTQQHSNGHSTELLSSTSLRSIHASNTQTVSSVNIVKNTYTTRCFCPDIKHINHMHVSFSPGAAGQPLFSVIRPNLSMYLCRQIFAEPGSRLTILYGQTAGVHNIFLSALFWCHKYVSP